MRRRSVLQQLFSLFKGLVIAGGLAYGGTAVAITLMQRGMVFGNPPQSHPAAPDTVQEETLPTKSGPLIVWYRAASAGHPTIVFFNGKGDTLARAIHYMDPFREAGYGLLLADYPGYDGNPGKATEPGLYEAGRAAISWLDGEGIHDPILMGYSLGTGVATEMAVEYPGAQALVLVSPYASMVDMGYLRVPFLPVNLLLWDRFESVAKVPSIHMPVLMLHGTADATIPLSQAQKLFDAANEPKHFVVVPGGGHGWKWPYVFEQVEEFLRGVPVSQAAAKP